MTTGDSLLQPGQTLELEFNTSPVDGTVHTGAVAMLSTPSLVRYFELVCHKMLQEKLPTPQTSVGTVVNIRHLAPAPIGQQIRVKATFISNERRRYTWEVQAWYGETKIGDGQHERAIVDPSRYQARGTGVTAG